MCPWQYVSKRIDPLKRTASWHVACSVWCVACGVWRVVCGVWQKVVRRKCLNRILVYPLSIYTMLRVALHHQEKKKKKGGYFTTHCTCRFSVDPRAIVGAAVCKVEDTIPEVIIERVHVSRGVAGM